MFVERLVQLDFRSFVGTLEHEDFVFIADDFQRTLHHLLEKRFPMAAGMFFHKLVGCGLGEIRHEYPVPEKPARDFTELELTVVSNEVIRAERSRQERILALVFEDFHFLFGKRHILVRIFGIVCRHVFDALVEHAVHLAQFLIAFRSNDHRLFVIPPVVIAFLVAVQSFTDFPKVRLCHHEPSVISGTAWTGIQDTGIHSG